MIVVFPWGCSSSSKTFESLSTAMEWIARKKLGIPHILHILDDFIIIGESTSDCQAKLQRLLHFCEDIGVPMAPEKKRVLLQYSHLQALNWIAFSMKPGFLKKR